MARIMNVAARRWRRNRPSRPAYPYWGMWSTPVSLIDGDDSQDADDGSQELESTGGDTALCIEDRCTSAYIAWMQQALNQLGAGLKFNGTLNRETISAINQFKQRRGVPAREYYASPRLEQALIGAGAAPPPAVAKLPCRPTPLKVLLPLLETPERHSGALPTGLDHGGKRREDRRSYQAL
jgi:hypothetical protein